MTTLKKHDISGNQIGTVEVDESIATYQSNGQLVKDYIVALRNNQRQWSASTKDRGQVDHTTKKPHAQKGTGRARQGMLSSPQFRGGGIVFGPQPKFDQHVRINKKERQAAIRHLVAEKIREGHFHILENPNLTAPKTKSVAAFLKSLELSGRVLFLGESRWTDVDGSHQVQVKNNSHDTLIKSIRNIPKASFAQVGRISGYDVICAREIVLTEEAFKELTEWLKPTRKKKVSS